MWMHLVSLSWEFTMSKEIPLVNQYLEGISRGAVDKHRVLFRSYVKRREGIYALYRKRDHYFQRRISFFDDVNNLGHAVVETGR